ncbi:hypothetical protein [Chitinophaga sp. CB10]|uniref:hypothetical protein n=1 Tax=Chitinophaga sp. CB10 TaxID=1891659 RepID=UPI0025BE881B|nr:hypothetical protein [Chitinophaga sp. CB10]
MSASPQPYRPIDCNYYDRLEAWATLHIDCKIDYYDDNGQPQELTAVIEDLYVYEKVEYMRMSTGNVIRLDRLIAVNDIPVPGSC